MTTTIQYPNVSDVRAIISSTLTDEQVQSFIDDSGIMASPCVFNYTPDRQKALLKWLTAHLISSSPNNAIGSGGKNLISQKLGDASETYANSSSSSPEALASTAYGKQALAFDTNGCLLGLGQKPVIFKTL